MQVKQFKELSLIPIILGVFFKLHSPNDGTKLISVKNLKRTKT